MKNLTGACLSLFVTISLFSSSIKAEDFPLTIINAQDEGPITCTALKSPLQRQGDTLGNIKIDSQQTQTVKLNYPNVTEEILKSKTITVSCSLIEDDDISGFRNEVPYAGTLEFSLNKNATGQYSTFPVLKIVSKKNDS